MVSLIFEAQTAIVYDVIGLGFGPANLAAAGALLEQPRETCPISVNKSLFIERHHEFRWHPGMLLPGTRMQISFLKDLATLRSPQSPITFVAYLHSQNRLVEFINRNCMTPTRKEYSDYLAHVARYVQGQGINVAYGENVIAIEEGGDGTVLVHSIVLTIGETIIRRAKNLIISPGGSPRVPRCIQSISPHPRIIHSSAYLSSVEPMLDTMKTITRPLKIAVVGAGQSAVEVLLDLQSRLTSMGNSTGQAHDLQLIIRGGSLKSSDGGPFSNQVYNPEFVDVMYDLPSDSRRRVMADYEGTNYGVVNPITLDSLFNVMYDQRVDSDIARRKKNALAATDAHITIITYSNLASAEISTHPSQTSTETETETDTHTFSVLLQNTLTQDFSEATYDAIICATGYERNSWLNLLKSSGLGKHFGLCATSDNTRLSVERDFRATINGKNGAFKAATNGINGHSRASVTGINGEKTHAQYTSTETKDSDTIYISRSHRLLPLQTASHESIPKIYLQGCAEETHGITETLLSVVGIRAGEVVEDLCSNY